MRILVTGARGFAGRHLEAVLRARGHLVQPLLHPSEGPAPEEGASADICDAPALDDAVRTLQPEACIHLAGIAFVPVGWEDPARVFEVNTVGVINLLEALRKHSPTSPSLVVTSAEVYGQDPSPVPLDESTALRPCNVYAASKAAADCCARLYAERYGMPVMTARPGNHIGPGQSPDFVVASFARQVAAIRDGTSPPRMMVGNLDSRRDFLDVRDVVRAYADLLEQGEPGEAYNLALGKAVAIRTILDSLCRLAGVSPDIEIDPDRFRPTDEPPLLCIDKIREHTGWRPELALEQTLNDVLRAGA